MSDPVLDEACALVERAKGGQSPKPEVRSFFDPATFTVTHVVACPQTRRAAIVDSVLDYEPASGRTRHASADELVRFVEAEGLQVDWHLETHVHADHLSAAPYLRDRLGGQIGIGREILTVQDTFGRIFNAGAEFARDGSQFDRLFADGEHLAIGALECVVLHVPGHTPADLAFVVGDTAFIGDTLFMPDYGTARADFPGGDAHRLFRSIRRLLSLPRETRLFLCHDYKAPGRDEYRWETSVGEQRDGNVHVHDGVTEDEFVARRTARDATLAMPTLILPSVQVNMRAGHFPPPDENGVSYLKIPVNAL